MTGDTVNADRDVIRIEPTRFEVRYPGGDVTMERSDADDEMWLVAWRDEMIPDCVGRIGVAGTENATKRAVEVARILGGLRAHLVELARFLEYDERAQAMPAHEVTHDLPSFVRARASEA